MIFAFGNYERGLMSNVEVCGLDLIIHNSMLDIRHYFSLT